MNVSMVQKIIIVLKIICLQFKIFIQLPSQQPLLKDNHFKHPMDISKLHLFIKDFIEIHICEKPTNCIPYGLNIKQFYSIIKSSDNRI